MPQFQRLCTVDEVPAGEGRRFLAGDRLVAVFNLGGQFFALADECPHAGASLALGEINGGCVTCRIHHWRFSIRDGSYLDEDKPRFNAASFATRIVGDELQVSLDG